MKHFPSRRLSVPTDLSWFRGRITAPQPNVRYWAAERPTYPFPRGAWERVRILLLLACGLLLASAVTVVGTDLSPDDVRNALNLGIRYLKSSQHANGTWSEYTWA